MKNKENDMMDFTQGSILKKLLRFMVPILGALDLTGGLRCGRPAGSGTVRLHFGIVRSLYR